MQNAMFKITVNTTAFTLSFEIGACAALATYSAKTVCKADNSVNDFSLSMIPLDYSNHVNSSKNTP